MAGVPQAKKTRPSCYLQIGCANYGGESGYGLFPSEYPARAGQELWPVLVASSCGQFLSGDGVEKQLGRGTDLSRANEHFSASLAASKSGLLPELNQSGSRNSNSSNTLSLLGPPIRRAEKSDHVWIYLDFRSIMCLVDFKMHGGLLS
ncbi:hypothetical protein PGTUg99_019826 [Puccinia graminis f. sp. tritici]|uniref:Uncharacterized protein n=1 Tax=Puccinia graminis f. sp. tritici TaxID=56615 RepID=A0A5B0PQP3_PUCGR|nr:hypothetical protein PGTUg99_019826 [Puccinia graminis f. sp. tritici]